MAKRNARERRRVQAVNSAFVQLRKCVPFENRNKRLSKVKTLQKAIEYIEDLTRTLSSLDPDYEMGSTLNVDDQRSASSLSLEESSSCVTDACSAELTPCHDPMTDYESESRAQDDDLLVLLEREYGNSVAGRSGGIHVNSSDSQQASCYPVSHQLASAAAAATTAAAEGASGAGVSPTSVGLHEAATTAVAAAVVAAAAAASYQHQHHEQVFTRHQHQHPQEQQQQLLEHQQQQQQHHHYFHNYLSQAHYHAIT